MRAVIGIALAGISGCSDGSTTSEPPPDATSKPTIDAGLGPWACQPGELLLEDGSCLPAGIAPEDCPQGFVATGDRSCEPSLIACARGSMALVGERECRPVAPCAAGTWGDIPVEPDTQHVAAGASSGDGSSQYPFGSVQQAVDNAVDGAIIAIAPGSYAENILVQGKRLRLWGVCPGLVDIAGRLRIDSDQSEVHTLAVHATADPTLQVAANDVVVDRVWVHDSALIGIDVGYDNPSAQIRGSLVELSSGLGIFGYGADIVVEDSVVRDIEMLADAFGEGVRVYVDDATGVASTLTMRRSIVQRVHGGGIQAIGSQAVIEDSVVHDVAADKDPEHPIGFGMLALRIDHTASPATLTVSGSHVENTVVAGIIALNSQATVERTVVRGVVPLEGGDEAFGMVAYVNGTVPDSHLTARAVVVEDMQAHGIGAIQAGAIIESTIVRNTRAHNTPSDPFSTGRGISIQRDSPPDHRLEVRGSRVERTHQLGIASLGHELTVESTLVSEVSPRDSDGFMGRGIHIQPNIVLGRPVTAKIKDSLIEHAHDCGVAAFAATLEMESTWVRDVLPSLDGAAGKGIIVQGTVGQWEANALLQRVLVEDNAGIGVVALAADARIEHSIVRRTRPDDRGLYGDGIAASPLASITAVREAGASITHSVVEDNQRAGVAAFGATISLEGLLIACNSIDLHGSTQLNIPHVYEDLGGNLCGCSEVTRACKVTSGELTAPNPLEP